MVHATVDNGPVSVTIEDSESVSVPDGEVWKVSITAASTQEGELFAIQVNGTNASTVNNDGTSGDKNPSSWETVLTEGDEISLSDIASGGTRGAHIGGFVVSE